MKFIFCKPPFVEFFFLFMSEIDAPVPGKQSWHVTMAVYDVTTSSAVILDSLKLFLDVNASRLALIKMLCFSEDHNVSLLLYVK